MLQLIIANKNYSSWSLRPWLLLRELGIPFEENVIFFGDEDAWRRFRQISPSGKVPCLRDGELTVWDSMAITEYLAEREPAVWPKNRGARAWARSAAAEMHSGFTALRSACSMSVGVRIRLHQQSDALARDLERLTALWNEGLSRFGGPFLGGAAFSAVDAFFAPVAFRLQTYGLDLGAVASAYAARLRALPSMEAWYEAALAERARDPAHEEDLRASGTWLADLRVPPAE
jgi:glutathione S-transferase